MSSVVTAIIIVTVTGFLGLLAWAAQRGKPTIDQAIAVTAHFPLFVAAFHRLRTGQEPLESRPELGYAANYLYLLTGQIPKEEHVRALNAYLVLLADHGMNGGDILGTCRCDGE